ncbi:MAG: hypothetical protein H0U18_02690 [Pyrinomonadaceae bacterium]|nr:hypothetical protein [Pyrinomonadaceae bacterium]
MKSWKKLLLLLPVLVLISQIPFAYRRYKLGRLHAAIQQTNSQRIATQDDFVEYKGVMHVHSFIGGHSTGGFDEIIAAAKSNQLDFVVMTEHPSKNFNTAEMTLKGVHAGVLFINGNEVSTAQADRLLVMPGSESAADTDQHSTQDVIARAKVTKATVFVAYPEEFRSWDSTNYDGVEVYNVYTNAREINPIVMFFDGLWSYRSYADLLFATFYERPAESLRRWDSAIATRKQGLVAVAGNDAHANVGLALKDTSGNTLLGLKLDPYERSFRLVRVHVLIPNGSILDTETLRGAIAAGHCFIGFDLFSDTSGFRFTGSNAKETRIQGEEIRLESEIRLNVTAPISSRIVLLRDGNAIQSESGLTRKEFVVTVRGSYRVELYLPQLPGSVSEQPWILSNPIYVK